MKIYREILRNTEMGIQSIKNIMKFVECDKLKNTLLNQKEVMEDFLCKSKQELSDEDKSQASSSKMQKTMLKASVNMNAMFNRDNSHIADMMIKGYTMGLTSIQKCVNDLKNDGIEIPQTACNLMEIYDKNIKDLREYI